MVCSLVLLYDDGIKFHFRRNARENYVSTGLLEFSPGCIFVARQPNGPYNYVDDTRY